MLRLVALVSLVVCPSSALVATIAASAVRCRPHTSPRAVPSTCSAADEAREKRLAAERLALEAQRAELEAERAALELEQKLLSRPSPPRRPVNEPKVEDASEETMALRAPLRWIGPYPALALSLPELSTPAQKARVLTGADGPTSGVTLDFVVDTAANTNTISAQVAGPTSAGGLELEQVGDIAGGVGAGGAIGGGATYWLGSAELADVPKSERIVFISCLQATALPIAAPAAAGLLGTSFLNSFPGRPRWTSLVPRCVTCLLSRLLVCHPQAESSSAGVALVLLWNRR